MRSLRVVGFGAVSCFALACAKPGRAPDANAPTGEDLARWSAAPSETSWHQRAAGPHRESELATDLDLGPTWTEGSGDTAPRPAVEGINESAYVGRVIPWQMETVVRHNASGFRACRDGTAGEARFKLYISSDGTNIRARIVQTTLSPKTTACLVQQWSRVTVPPPDGGPAVAIVPIVFNN
jgi:hypothetical protein